MVGGQREAALQELHDRHASELWRFAMRLTHDRQLSEDVVQEVLLKAWKDPSLGQRDEAAARAWLFTASRNLIIDRWRSAASRHEQRIEEAPEESVGDARIFERVRDSSQTKAALRVLANSTNAWVREYVVIALRKD